MNKCDLVRDLLPNYLEGLTSESSKEFIESHLDECTECKKIYENMLEDIGKICIDEKKDIKFLDKIKKTYQIKGIFLSLSLIIFFCLGIYYLNTEYVDIPKDQVNIGRPYKLSDGRICFKVDIKEVKDTSMIRSEGIRIKENQSGEEKESSFEVSFKTSIADYLFNRGREDDIVTKIITFRLDENAVKYEDGNVYGKKTLIKTSVKDAYYINKDDKKLVWDEGMDIEDATREMENLVDLEYTDINRFE